MKPLLASVVALLVVGSVRAEDWPQFQGPDRSNVSKEKGLLDAWPKGGPKLLWTFKDAGVGYSGPAVVGDRLYTCGADKDNSYLLAVNVKDGKEAWRLKLGSRFSWKGNTWGDGPRATPAVADGHVYALDGGGEVVCATVEGKEVWRKSLPKDFGGVVNHIGGSPEGVGWGFSASPLIDGDQVVLMAGSKTGTLLALDRKTGSTVWQTKDLTDMASYSSPVVATLGGVKQYVVLLYRGIAGVEAKTGNLLWFYDKKPPYGDVLIPAPIVSGDHVYATNGSNSPNCDLVKVTAADGKFTATKAYSNKNMKSNTGGLALVDGHVYGFSDKRGWICQDFLKGTIKWQEKPAYSGGSLTYADGHLYLYGEDDGLVTLIEASPEGWKDKGSFEIPMKTANQTPGGKKWTYPVVSNGRLYLRDQELLFCYDVKK